MTKLIGKSIENLDKEKATKFYKRFSLIFSN